MDLHDPAALCILSAEEEQHGILVFFNFFCGQGLSGNGFFKNGFHFAVAGRAERHAGDPVVRSFAAHFPKEVHPFRKGGVHVLHGFNLHAGGLAEGFHVLRERRFVNVVDFVGAPGRNHTDFAGRIGLDFFMPFQAVRRIVRRADQLDIRLLNDAAHAQGVGFQLGVAQVPDFFRRVRIQYAIVAEIPFQFQMCPMVHRVADCFRESFGKFLELLPVACAARDGVFRHAVRADHAPFVMVAAEPYLGNVVEFAVFRDFLRINMAVVVDDGHVLGVLVV